MIFISSCLQTAWGRCCFQFLQALLQNHLQEFATMLGFWKKEMRTYLLKTLYIHYVNIIHVTCSIAVNNIIFTDFSPIFYFLWNIEQDVRQNTSENFVQRKQLISFFSLKCTFLQYTLQQSKPVTPIREHVLKKIWCMSGIYKADTDSKRKTSLMQPVEFSCFYNSITVPKEKNQQSCVECKSPESQGCLQLECVNSI